MGFLERTRSLRRKDSAVPLQRREQSNKASTAPATPREAAPRPSTSKTTTSSTRNVQTDSTRPRTNGREDHYLPGLDYHTFRFPTPSGSPRISSSHSRNLTLQNNSSSSALVSNQPGRPECKRSFTTPMHVAHASIQQGTVRSSTKEIPKIEPKPAPAPEKKRPTLHKSKSSTWRSFFQRKQSRPPVPDFDPAEVALPPQSKKAPVGSLTRTDAQSAVPHPSTSVPTKGNGQNGNESRGLRRQNMRAEMEKAHFEKQASPMPSKMQKSAIDSPQQLRPQVTRSITTSTIGSERFFDAMSRSGSPAASPMGGPGKGPRLEVSIPDVGLERYSVMFEKLLKPKQSLMERRKTMVLGLNLPGEQSPAQGKSTPSLETPGRPVRRATSPNLQCPTPLTAELLESSSQMATPVAIHRVSGVGLLRRSRTAPPGAMSPGRAEFLQRVQPTLVQTATAENTSSATSTRHSPIWSEASLPPTPASETGTFMSLDDEDENDDDDEEEAEIVTYDMKSLKPQPREPGWNMVSPALATSTSYTFGTIASNKKTAPPTAAPPPIPPRAPGRTSREGSVERALQYPPRTSSLENLSLPPTEPKHRSVCVGALPKQHIAHQQAPQKSKQHAHPNPLGMNQVHGGRPVQISIARQVSVRRPSGGQTATVAAGAGAAAGGKTPRAVGTLKPEPSPMFSKQPLRPKVVEVRNRKSTMVVLESASNTSSASVSRENLLSLPK